ncbi:MAG: YggS family pyridoxal phosphate-dependent enzyme [Bacteroidota bacterium]|nr:YggS family pyridoxal phosphate-dependent enzyme [Bacteroidota bacterium]MED5364368.1 YggS family pyridoxal phosphate-dependent enzyme [Bacteroidota bacterium]|tara:strand:+ start:2948 stop:3589 length:642 start_codon:yes stop_codon:yes gene_type:complete
MISKNIIDLKKKIGTSVNIIAVSKNNPKSSILECFHSGHIDFGENRVQELCEKAKSLPDEINWHMIGKLQRNKVKYIVSFIHLIHSVDSVKLLNEIDKQSKKINRIINVLIQVHIAKEKTKSGFSYDEAEILLSKKNNLKNINIIGLMGMSTFTSDKKIISDEFKKLNEFYVKWKSKHNFSILSMGMSNDYMLAIENGSNLIRIGSLIFGSRI